MHVHTLLLVTKVLILWLRILLIFLLQQGDSRHKGLECFSPKYSSSQIENLGIHPISLARLGFLITVVFFFFCFKAKTRITSLSIFVL